MASVTFTITAAAGSSGRIGYSGYGQRDYGSISPDPTNTTMGGFDCSVDDLFYQPATDTHTSSINLRLGGIPFRSALRMEDVTIIVDGTNLGSVAPGSGTSDPQPPLQLAHANYSWRSPGIIFVVGNTYTVTVETPDDPWIEQYVVRAPREVGPPVNWRPQYALSPPVIGPWVNQYSLSADLGNWQDQYHLPSPAIGSDWEDQYQMVANLFLNGPADDLNCTYLSFLATNDGGVLIPEGGVFSYSYRGQGYSITSIGRTSSRYNNQPEIRGAGHTTSELHFQPHGPPGPSFEVFVGPVSQGRTTNYLGHVTRPHPGTTWYRQRGLPNYELPSGVAEGQSVLVSLCYPTTWRQQYTLATPDIAVPPSWQEQYTLDPPDIDDRWRDQYELRRVIPDPAGVVWREQYLMRPAVLPPPPDDEDDGNIFVLIINGVLTRITHAVLSARAKLGRNNAAFLARVLPLQGQLVLNNQDGEYDPKVILPGNPLEWLHDAGGGETRVVAGYVRSVKPGWDFRDNIRTTIIHFEGILSTLEYDDYELPLFVTDDVRTDEIITSVADNAGFPEEQRDIERGQVRIHPAHYASVLNPRALHQSSRIVRATEEAEIGLVHEKRGDTLTFRHRFHRELDKRDSLFVIGHSDDALKPIKSVIPDDSWDNMWTAVQVGAERAVVQSERVVYTFRKDDIDDNPLIINADSDISFDCDLETEEQNRERSAVRAVASWAPVAQGDIEFRRDDNNQLVIPTLGDSGSDLLVTFKYRRTSVNVRIRNRNIFALKLTKLELRGRGIALYGDLTIPEIPDDEAIATYRRRVLRLPTSFIGDGINEGGDPIAEGRVYAETLLARYSRPQISARIPVNATRDALHLLAMETLQISDPVLVQGGFGLPGGGYWVEGLDFEMNARDSFTEMGIYVSQRGRRVFTRDQAIDVTANNRWQDIAPAVTLADDRRYVVGAKVSFPDDAVPGDELVMILRKGVVRASVWTEKDIPIGEPHFLASVVKGPGDVKIEVRQGTNALTAIQWCVVRIDS